MCLTPGGLGLVCGFDDGSLITWRTHDRALLTWYRSSPAPIVCLALTETCLFVGTSRADLLLYPPPSPVTTHHEALDAFGSVRCPSPPAPREVSPSPPPRREVTSSSPTSHGAQPVPPVPPIAPAPTPPAPPALATSSALAELFGASSSPHDASLRMPDAQLLRSSTLSPASPPESPPSPNSPQISLPLQSLTMPRSTRSPSSIAAPPPRQTPPPRQFSRQMALQDRSPANTAGV